MSSNLLDRTWKVTESVSLGDLLTFSVRAVRNLYKIEESTDIFKFEHKDGDYLAKANSKLSSSIPIFEAYYEDSFMTEFGISYVGYIQIESPSSSHRIYLPADKSFDPAGSSDKVWVESHQINKLLVFTCVLITAARFGANSKFIRRLYNVMKPIITKYYKKKFLFKWMYLQVKLACLKDSQPPSYTEFINTHGKSDTRQYSKDVELVKSGKIERVSIPEEYFSVTKSEIGQQGGLGDEGEVVIEIPLQCFSPDIEEDFIPNVQEIHKDLVRVKERYESEVQKWIKRIEGIKGHKKVSGEFLLGKSFEAQCPVF